MLTMARSRVLLLVLCFLAQWSWPAALAELSYLQCVNVRSLNQRKVLVFPMNQTDLNQPGPSACAETCVKINETYIYFLVHIPASGSFTNQLVCGCGTKGAFPIHELPDSSCNLPCPLGLNSSVEFIDATRLTGGLMATIEPWFPLSDGPRFLALPGGVPAGQNNTSKRRRRPPATHRTCGNGHGLLSAYEFLRSSSANNSQLKSLTLLLLMLVCYIM